MGTTKGRVHRSSSPNSINSNDAFHSVVALHYRDGDADQPLDMQANNQRSIDEAAASKEVATPTRDSRQQHHFGVSMPQFMLFALPSIKVVMPSTPPPSKEDEQQIVMDEYIEYYERRYSRLHPEHRRHARRQNHQTPSFPKVVMDFPLPRNIFLSMLALHNNRSPTASSTHPKTSAASAPEAEGDDTEEEEDPLNRLGLSSLASARLRQRLQVPVDLRDEHTLLTSGTTSAVNFYHSMMHHNSSPTRRSSVAASAAATTTGGAVASSAEGGRQSSYIGLSFPGQVQLLVKTMLRLTLAFKNTIKILTAFASRMFSEVLEKGGFRHSVRMMSVASVAVLLMFRPLFKGAMRQG